MLNSELPSLSKMLTLNTSFSLFEELLGDKYELIEKIGEGTYGFVYKAKDIKTRENVAIKKITHIQNQGLQCNIEPFIMNSLSHPHLLPCKEVVCHPSFTCIVMPLAKKDMFHYLKHHPTVLTMSQKIKWCGQLCQAVACLHQNHIIHGDIKTDNLLLMEDLSLKLADFTLSVFEWKDHLHQHNVCTFTYRPPEVFLGQSWNRSVDIWALGCTLYEIIYNKPLFIYPGEINNHHNTSDEDALKYKMLCTYKEWAKLTNQEISPLMSTATKKTFKYLFPTWKGTESEDYRLIDDLIISLLQVDPFRRPSVFQTLAHPVFRDALVIHPFSLACSWTPTVFEETECPLELVESVRACPKFLASLISHFYHYLQLQLPDSILIDKSIQAWVVVFMLAKLTHRPMIEKPPFDWPILNSWEIKVSESVQWKFPLAVLRKG